MRKTISIVLIVLTLCNIFAFNVNAIKVDIPFDYNVSPVNVNAKADNNIVSVEVCDGGIIKTTSLSDNQTQIIKHVCYEDIYWIKYSDNQFVAFSENYMLTSYDGYNWNTIEDLYNTKRDGTTLHEAYGVDWSSSDRLYSFNIEPDFEVIDSQYTRDDGRIVYCKIVYTGQEWLKFEDIKYWGIDENRIDDHGVFRSLGDFDRVIYRSSDRQNWEYIETRESNLEKFEAGETDEIIPFPGFRYDADIQIINTGKEYLTRSTENDSGGDRYGYSWPIFVYDYNYNYVDTIKVDGNIVDMSYVDDIYYLTNDKSVTYKSVDLKNWEIVGEKLGCPMSNGLSTIYKTRFNIRDNPKQSSIYYNGTITAKNSIPDKNIVTEGIMLFNTRKYGDFYVAFDGWQSTIFDKRQNTINNNYIDRSEVKGVDGNILDIYRNHPLYKNQYISFSKDGVYWAALDIPETWNVSSIDMSSEGLVIRCNNVRTTRLISVKFSDMEKVVPYCDTKVELNNRVLGFSQPPVMEDDRILVPMRFLFEQMGASVDWNDATQTATATISEGAPKGFVDSAAAVGLAEQGTAIKSEAKPLAENTKGEVQNTVTFSIDNTTATVNGETETMDVPARLINDQTFVPLRFLSESLGCDVQWDEVTNTAIVTTK